MRRWVNLAAAVLLVAAGCRTGLPAAENGVAVKQVEPDADPPAAPAAGPPPSREETEEVKIPARPEAAGKEPPARPAAPAPVEIPKEIEAQDREIRAGNANGVLDAYRQRLQAEPGSAALHYLYGRLLGNLRSLEEARAAFDRSIELDPELPWPYRGRGIYYLKKEMLDHAQREFERAHRLDPARAVFLSDLAQVHFMAGRSPEALALIARAIAAEPRTAAHRSTHATMLHRLGKLEEAIAELKAALSLDPDDFDAYLFLAEILVGAERLEEALGAYRQLVARLHDKERLERAQARIRHLEEVLRATRIARIREGQDQTQLQRHLKSGDLAVRREAHRALLLRRHKSDLPAFYAGSGDADPAVRVYCVRGLAEVGDAEAVPFLLRLLRLDADHAVRGAAAGALGRLARPPILPDLSRVLAAEKSAYVLSELLAAMKRIAGADPGVELDESDLAGSRERAARAWESWWKANGPR